MYHEIDLDKIDRNSEPPAEEPTRQYYFMAKCREWVFEFERKNGRRPWFFIQTFGCQMNARDSEKLRGILQQMGMESTESETADFVLYNTCTVRDNANQKVYGHLGYLQTLKKKNPEMKIALCGCMMQEPKVRGFKRPMASWIWYSAPTIFSSWQSFFFNVWPAPIWWWMYGILRTSLWSSFPQKENISLNPE